MPTFRNLNPESSLSDALRLFPANSGRLLRLLNDIMCAEGELSRGEREAIAAFVSEQNATSYCVYYHTLFSEVVSGPVEATQEQLGPLLIFASKLRHGREEEIANAFTLATDAGWSEKALYEVVEIAGVFSFINTIVRAAGLKPPEAAPSPYPTRESLKGSYASMAALIDTD